MGNAGRMWVSSFPILLRVTGLQYLPIPSLSVPLFGGRLSPVPLFSFTVFSFHSLPLREHLPVLPGSVLLTQFGALSSTGIGNSQRPRHLVGDTDEWINEIPSDSGQKVRAEATRICFSCDTGAVFSL